MDSTGFSYQSKGIQRNTSNPRDARASAAVNDWAAKKREQIERAKQLREERKYGSSHLQNAGENQLVGAQNMTPSSAIRQSQRGYTPGSFPSQAMQSYEPSNGAYSYNEYLNENNQDKYKQSNPASQYEFNQNKSFDNSTTPTQNNRRQNSQAMQDPMSHALQPQRSQLAPSYGASGYSGMGMSTQEDFRNQYSYSKPQDRHNTISHDQNPSMTQFSNGFPKPNPLSRRQTGQPTGPGGFLNQTSEIDPRMRSTAYTREDVQEARDGLKLLKSRMADFGSKKRESINNNNSSSHSNRGEQIQPPPMQRRTNQYGGASANKPPMMPHHQSQTIDSALNHSVLSGPSGTTPRNSHYRQAFKPNLQVNSNFNGAHSIQTDPSPVYDKQNKLRTVVKDQVQYKPEARSPHVPRRQLSTNNPKEMQPRGPNPNNPYKSSQYDTEDPFNQGGIGGGPSRVVHTPIKGVRHSPAKTQPTQKTYTAKPGVSIYEAAAMQAAPDALPNNVPEELVREDDGTRVPCSICDRKFHPDSIDKHERICNRVFQQKRKAFDMKEQRKAEGADELQAEQKYNKPYGKKQTVAKAEPAKAGGGMPKWKQQSLQFRQAMGGGNKGGSNFNPSMQESAQHYDDRTECQFCLRKFAHESAARHIPVCEQKYKQNLMKNGGAKQVASKRGTQMGFRKQNF